MLSSFHFSNANRTWIRKSRKAVTLAVASARLRLMVNHSHSQAVSWVVLHVFGSLGRNVQSASKMQGNAEKKFGCRKERKPIGELLQEKKTSDRNTELDKITHESHGHTVK